MIRRIADQVRPQCVGRARERGVVRDDVDGISGLSLNDDRDLPPFLEPIALERQIVNRIDDEAMPHVIVGGSFGFGEVVAVLRR